MTDFSFSEKSEWSEVHSDVAGAEGLEPSARGFGELKIIFGNF